MRRGRKEKKKKRRARRDKKERQKRRKKIKKRESRQQKIDMGEGKEIKRHFQKSGLFIVPSERTHSLLRRIIRKSSMELSLCLSG